MEEGRGAVAETSTQAKKKKFEILAALIEDFYQFFREQLEQNPSGLFIGGEVGRKYLYHEPNPDMQDKFNAMWAAMYNPKLLARGFEEIPCPTDLSLSPHPTIKFANHRELLEGLRVASAGSSRAVTAAWYAARKEEADFKEQFLKLEEIERRFGLAQIKSSGSPYSVDRNISAGLTTGMQLAWDFIQVALDNLPDGLTEELSRILVHRKTRHTLLQLASISVPELLLFRDYLKGGSPRLVVREGSLQLSEGINLDRQGWDAWNTQPIVLGCPALHSKGGVSNVILELWELCIKIYSAYQELQSVALRTRVQMKICFLETGEPEINQILRKKSTRPGTEGHSLTRKS